MRQIAIADCETDPFKYGRVPKPFVWGYFDGLHYLKFWGKNCTSRFFNYIKDKEVILFAHNGGKFDWHFLLDRIEPFTPLTIINGRIALFKIGDCEFRDSFSILPFALAKYQKKKIDYWKMEIEDRDNYRNEILEYLKSDCVYLFNLVHRFINLFGLNLTVACTAFSQWRKISKRKNPSTTVLFYDYIKPYYFGGRVQCFQKGIINHPFIYLDINSAYPYAMIHNHPYGENLIVSSKLPKSITKIQQSFIHLKCKSKGDFPYRSKINTTYPNDNKVREFYISGWEYLTARGLKRLKKVKILEVLRFETYINFKDYVNHFYEIKNQAKETGERDKYLYAKFLLNSLYGKFAADYRNYMQYMIIEKKHLQPAERDEWFFNSIIGKYALVEKNVPAFKHRFYNIAVSASITGFVRAYLIRSLHNVNNPLYCDTDSIACESVKNLTIGKKIGQWAIQADCLSGAIAGKKLYAFKTKRKYITASKGVRLSPKQIIKIAQNKTVIYKPKVPTFSIHKNPVFTDRTVKMT